MQETGDIENFVVQAVAEVTNLSPRDLWARRSANVFQEDGLDQLLALEIVETLEHRYRIQVPEERIGEITSVDGTVALVKEILASSKQT